ncbi:7676_t:CDS:2, partial [Acaulospora morrowiae]
IMWLRGCFSNLFLRRIRGPRYFHDSVGATIKSDTSFQEVDFANHNGILPQAPVKLQAVNPLPKVIEAIYYDFVTNEPLGMKNLDRQVFGAPIRVDILQRVATWQRDALRQGTHKTKTRGEVSGTGKKWAPQKGRGKARVGSHRVPHWRGGGVAHGPRPRSYATDLPRQIQVLGVRTALATKYVQNQLVLVENFKLNTHKTKELLEILDKNAWDPLAEERVQGHSILFMSKDHQLNLDLASRNLQRVHALTAEEIFDAGDVYNIMGHEILMLDLEAVDVMEEALKFI